MRTDFVEQNLCGFGAYEIAVADGDAEIAIFASGSEVEIALAARALLQKGGHSARVVSVPCFELFEMQSEDYKASILGDAPVKVAVEAAIRLGWDRFIGTDGIFVGMTGFGASGSIEQLYPHFGITAQAVADAAMERLHSGPGKPASSTPKMEPARPLP
jgi:transketolase